VKRREQPHDVRVFFLSLLAGLPAVAATLLLLVAGDYSAKVNWTVGAIVIAVWLALSAAVRERVLRPLQTASNLVAALREGDFSVRGRGARLGDPLGEVEVGGSGPGNAGQRHTPGSGRLPLCRRDHRQALVRAASVSLLTLQRG